MSGDLLFSDVDVELLLDAVRTADWNSVPDVSEIDGPVVGTFFFYFEPQLLLVRGKQRNVDEGTALLRGFCSWLAGRDAGLDCPDAVLHEIGNLLPADRAADAAINGVVRKILGKPVDVETAPAEAEMPNVRYPPCTSESEEIRRNAGLLYLRALVSGSAWLTASLRLFAEAIGALHKNQSPGIADRIKAIVPSWIARTLPELNLPYRHRAHAVYYGVQTVIASWRKRSHTLMNMVDPSLAVTLRLARESSGNDPVVLIGETGTGKELAARVIHELSGRKDRPFVPVNCGGLSDDLARSELFGHKKGAFTGAIRDKKGAFEEAHGGTVFLDEVGELSQSTQTLLLRALSTGRIAKLGQVEETMVDVRILAATNRNLPAEVEAGRFRQDLYYRLKSDWAVVLPALSFRSYDDLAAIWTSLVAQESAADKATVSPCKLTPSEMNALCEHPWPGNIRQMQWYAREYVEQTRGRETPLSVDGFLRMADSYLRIEEQAQQAQAHSGGPWPSPSVVEQALVTAEKVGLKQLIASLKSGIVGAALVETGGSRLLASQRLGISEAGLTKILQRAQRSASKSLDSD